MNIELQRDIDLRSERLKGIILSANDERNISFQINLISLLVYPTDTYISVIEEISKNGQYKKALKIIKWLRSKINDNGSKCPSIETTKAISDYTYISYILDEAISKELEKSDFNAAIDLYLEYGDLGYNENTYTQRNKGFHEGFYQLMKEIFFILKEKDKKDIATQIGLEVYGRFEKNIENTISYEDVAGSDYIILDIGVNNISLMESTAKAYEEIFNISIHTIEIKKQERELEKAN